MAVKIHPVWPHQQYGRHTLQYLTVVRRIPAALLSIRCRARRSVPKRGKHDRNSVASLPLTELPTDKTVRIP